jgi:hypothetical protein
MPESDPNNNDACRADTGRRLDSHAKGHDMTPHDKRPRLDDILSGGSDGDNFAALWDATEAAGEREPLPAGTYRCLVVNGERAESKAKGTPSYKITYEIVDPTDFAGRKVWLDLWLTPRALPMTKRDLAKLRIHTPGQLRQAPPSGMLADVKLACRTGDDGTTFNRVVAFAVVGEAADADLDADEDTRDAAGFDWSNGTPREAPHR